MGTRKYNIFHCQLRNLASNLNQHKFLSHLSDSWMCSCGDDVENNFHYFYVCPLFICQRILLFTQLRDLADFLSIDVLLKGSHDLSFDDYELCPHLYLWNQETWLLTFFNFILYYLLWIFFLFNLLLKMVKQIYIYIYVYMYAYVWICHFMCLCIHVHMYP